MHGRVRGRDASKSDTEIAAAKEALQVKAKMYGDLTSLVRKLRQSGDHSPKALDLTTKLLRINPDYYTLWNYRREILLGQHGESMGLIAAYDSSSSKISEEIGGSLRDAELQLSKEAILKNPKAYGAWWHRCWIIQRFCTNYKSELNLCSEFLNQDQRNFHCWNYRRYVIQIGDVPAEDEFSYSTEKINQNFSNYSAFHHRSVFITQIPSHQTNIENIKAAMQVEFAIVENATFTDPYDQSAWWYHRFVLHWMKKNILEEQKHHQEQGDSDIDTTSSLTQWCVGILEHQIENITSLVEFEPQCKWPVNALVYLLGLLQEIQGKTNIENQTKIHELLETLKNLDPIRSRRYDEAQKQVAIIC